MVDLSLRGQHQEASRLVAASRPGDARDICYRILEAFPRHVATYVVLGQAYLRLGNRPAAVALFRRVLSVDPERPEVHLGLATVFERRGDLHQALWHLERAFELASGEAQVREALIRVRRQARPGVAPEGPLELTQGALARLYLRGRLYAKAVQELRELLDREPEREDLRIALAEALWRNREWEQAESACQRVLAELPYCLKANLLLGSLWLGTRKEPQGRALLGRAQSLDPDNEMAQHLFGTRSPLPPRASRLPFREEDAPPLDLSYLWADEEQEGATPPDEPPPRDEAAPSEVSRPPTAPPSEAPAPAASSPQEAADRGAGSEEVAQGAQQPPIIVAGGRRRRPSPTLRDEARREPGERSWRQRSAESAGPLDWDDEREEGLSLLDVQRQYVAEHPEDARAHLDLARDLRDGGHLAEALDHYLWLVENDYPLLSEAVADLEFLNRLYPRTPELERLLAEARTRSLHAPGSRPGP